MEEHEGKPQRHGRYVQESGMIITPPSMGSLFAKLASTFSVSSSEYGYLQGRQAGERERKMYVQLNRGCPPGTVLTFTCICMIHPRRVLVPFYR